MGLSRDEWWWFEDKATGQLSELGRYRGSDKALHGTRINLQTTKKEAKSLCAHSERVVKIKIVKVEES